MPANPTSVREARQRIVGLFMWSGPVRSEDPRMPLEGTVHEAMDDLVRAVRSERDAEIRGMVEGMKYDPAVEGHNGFEASIFNGAMNAVLALLTDREGA